MKLNALLTTLVLIGFNVQAQEKLELNYDGFFDRMDDIESAEYQGVKLAFYLKDKNGVPCAVKQAKLTTKIKQQDVYVLESGEILLPYEPLLDQDKAILVIDKADNKECGLNMSLESNLLFEQQVPKQQALQLTNTFDAAFDDLGGMMSFMLPKVKGITFKFKQGVEGKLLNSSIANCNIEKGCTVLKEELEQIETDLTFSHKPVKVVPYIQ